MTPLQNTKSWAVALRSDSVQFLSLDEVISIQERVIERFGGQHGVRDRGLLESALFRPQTGYYEDLAEMAAALFESRLVNHAFLDGNKRVAFFATDVFLRMNGWKLQVIDSEAFRFIVGMLERGDCSYEKVLPWVRQSIVEL